MKIRIPHCQAPSAKYQVSPFGEAEPPIFHLPSSIFGREAARGSVLIVAMLMIVVGTIGMASMTTLLSTRTRFVMDMEHSIQRRVALRNCRALVHYYFMRQGIAADAPGGTLTLPYNWGKVVIPETTTSPLGSLQEFSLINFLSPALDHGFSQDVTVTIHQPIPYDDAGGIVETDYQVQLKSRSPLLAGTLLVLHKPMGDFGQAPDLQGSIHVNGHSLLWEDSDLTGLLSFRTRTYDHPDRINENIRNLGGNHIPPTNFPFYLRSTGYADVSVTGAPVLDGRFNMMQLGAYPPPDPDPDDIKKKNTLHYKMVASSSPRYVDDGAVTGGGVSVDEVAGETWITIDLNTPGLPTLIINDGVEHLHLKGYINSATGDDEPPGFILVRSAELKTLTLENENYRRFVIGIEGNNQPVNVSTENATEWRMLLTATGAPLVLDLAANTLALQGGVRTDSRLSVTTGTLVLNREYNPDTLEIMDPREAWIEIYSDL